MSAHFVASPCSRADDLVAAALDCRRRVAALRFPLPVRWIYNPLDYAWVAHELYLRRFGRTRKRVVFLGMNPGPFGMAQTGVPFGEVAAVRDWLKITVPVGRPRCEHPRRPVEGFNCRRSEVSGRRLWCLFAERFGTPERFFAENFVANYCPVAFLSETGRNLTPDKLPAASANPLFAACDAHLRRMVEILQPDWVIAVGDFAGKRARAVLGENGVNIGRILHPSPASPAANRDWSGQATRQMHELGVWN